MQGQQQLANTTTVISSVNSAYPSSPSQMPHNASSMSDTPPPLTPVSQHSISPPTVGQSHSHNHTPVSPYSQQSSPGGGHAVKFFGGVAPYHTGGIIMSPSYSPDASTYAHHYIGDGQESYMARQRNNSGGDHYRTPSPTNNNNHHDLTSSAAAMTNMVMHSGPAFLKLESSE